MKRLTALLLSALMLAALCIGCAGKNNSIIGKWSYSDTDTYGGYIFGDNGKVSIFHDISESIHFENDAFVFADNRIEGSGISYDGSLLTVEDSGQSLMELRRTGEDSPGNKDGEYRLEGGIMLSSLKLSMDIPVDSEAVILLDIYGSSVTITAVDIMDYSYDGKLLKFSGYPAGQGASEESSGNETVISGDEMRIKRSDGSERTLKKCG